ncbi:MULTISPECIES: substrate-binding domain-containing protein [unclassified Micromonospora]|uniref:substrate-binding domain-containing protein n=1 Tax=unclassified Micromonospora TaxID=2617518 RepID=UPI001C23669E|nr:MULTISPECIES: substrate-binding domain-containing protein [unclassified Micromonospora]MBU8855859.1 substrate-binding domain-containing protein [Micromonospora sp. WMMB482]MDM4781462.1 substrate-binding domain-containing protein [Micromonospora sp. b486]
MDKRTTLLALLVTGALAATGCSVEKPSDDAGQARACGAGKDFLIGMSQANNAEPYRQVMNNDVQTAAKSVPGLRVVVSDAAQDNSKQVADVENFLTQKIDLLIVSPNEAKPLTAVVKKAYDQGVPVIVLDRKVEGDAYTAFIGGDNVAIGKAAGEFYATTLLPDGGKVIEIAGLPGSTPAAERAQGFRDGIAANPKIQIVASQPGDWLREKGQSVADALIKAHPDVSAIYAHNDPMAEGAYLAAKSAGKAQRIKFTGIDALPVPSGGIKAVEQGRLAATFQYATGGREAVELARKILVDCAEDVPRTTTLGTMRITKENAAEAYAKLGGL